MDNDELADAQNVPAKMVIAARLRKMQEYIDYVIPSVEAEMLVAVSKDELKRYGRQSLITKKSLRDRLSSDTVRHARYSFVASSKESIASKLVGVRAEADYIKKELEMFTEAKDKENALMRFFIVNMFRSYRKEIVGNYVLGAYESVRYQRVRPLKRRISVVLIPVFYFVMLYYIYLYNLAIGSRASAIWLIVTSLTFVQDVLFIEPITIWLKWVLVHGMVNGEVQKVFDCMRTRFRSIINRKAGIMRDTHSLIQHFNPACRAARMFPELPVSRFLMCLNDYDIPYFDVSHSVSGDYMSTVGSIVVVLLALLFWLPVSIQDTLIRFVAHAFTNVPALVLFQVGKYNVASSAILALLIIAIVLGGGYFYELTPAQQKELLKEDNLIVNILNATIYRKENGPKEKYTVQESALDVNATIDLDEKMKPLQELPTHWINMFSKATRTVVPTGTVNSRDQQPNSEGGGALGDIKPLTADPPIDPRTPSSNLEIRSSPQSFEPHQSQGPRGPLGSAPGLKAAALSGPPLKPLLAPINRPAVARDMAALPPIKGEAPLPVLPPIRHVDNGSGNGTGLATPLAPSQGGPPFTSPPSKGEFLGLSAAEIQQLPPELLAQKLANIEQSIATTLENIKES